MLQQTTVAAVIPYFETFIAAWPTVKDLAAADPDDVMKAWAGLGYYARARNMLKCAVEIAERRQGQFPRDERDLLELPGIGAYTAAAIAAIAFQGPAAPVDGNVIRVLSRLYAIADIMPAGKAVVGDYAERMLPPRRSGDFAEALMDLGATVCKPKNPDCPACPWREDCAAHAAHEATAYPKKAPKKEKPTRRGWAFWLEREDGAVLLERRPDKGLLGGMMGFPTTAWEDSAATAEDAARAQGLETWSVCEGMVRHTFTHFHLELQLIKAQGTRQSGQWVARDELSAQALPTVMRKVIQLAS